MHFTTCLSVSCVELAKSYPIWVLEFARTGKKGHDLEFFVRILNPDILFFIFLLSEPGIDLNLVLSELSNRKNRILDINFLSKF